MSPLASLIERLEQDDSLDRADRLRDRLEALDRLEAHAFAGTAARPDGSGADGSDQLDGLHTRASAMSRRLEAANAALYERLRTAIRRGAGPDPLREFVRDEFARDKDAPAAPASGEGYDHLDALVSGILQFEEPDAGIAELEPEMVFYQPTPARHIFDLFARAALTVQDVLVDLGAGLGHVPLLTSICTPARSIGIERERAYVECARRSARALNLARATFIAQDARAADLSSGTVFYLYTPFSGTILRDVLDALRRQAVDREIRVCTYGPCTPIVSAEDWLEANGTPETGRVAVFRSRGPAHARSSA